jgi:hypothetical protein
MTLGDNTDVYSEIQRDFTNCADEMRCYVSLKQAVHSSYSHSSSHRADVFAQRTYRLLGRKFYNNEQFKADLNAEPQLSFLRRDLLLFPHQLKLSLHESVCVFTSIIHEKTGKWTFCCCCCCCCCCCYCCLLSDCNPQTRISLCPTERRALRWVNNPIAFEFVRQRPFWAGKRWMNGNSTTYKKIRVFPCHAQRLSG